jgi:P-loop containing NTP hydrolase pore-1
MHHCCTTLHGTALHYIALHWQAVLELQEQLPNARVVYCSATGASEPRNLGYMSRLGLWGAGSPFPDGFKSLLDAVDSKGVGAMELLAMYLKQSGSYLCRTLSFAGCGFELVTDTLSPEMAACYDSSAAFWQRLRRIIQEALKERESLRSEVRCCCCCCCCCPLLVVLLLVLMLVSCVVQ